MMDIQIGNPSAAYLFVMPVLALLLGMYGAFARHRASRVFATDNLAARMLPPSLAWRRGLSIVCLAAGFAFLVLALMDIRWGKTTREVPQKGIEVMFALDVSRSMLAEDVAPNRLARAKQQINDMIDEMSGDRIGLVAFAGDVRQSVPLTSHYEDFRQTLDSLGPHSVHRGGSRLGDAIRVATLGFIDKTQDHKAIIIFTDGEDQESDPVDAAETAVKTHGIRIFTVGLGDMDTGALVPAAADNARGTSTNYAKFNGQPVRSKLNGKILSQIATQTNGAYIPAGTQTVNMSDVYHGYVANVPQTEFETASIEAYTARYQWFAASALVLLMLEVLLSTRRQRNIGSSTLISTKSIVDRPLLQRTAASILCLGSLAGFATPASAAVPTDQQIAEQINRGNELVRKGDFQQAVATYADVQAVGELGDQLAYARGVAQYRSGDIESAADSFTIAAGSSEASLAARSQFNLGNCYYSQGLDLAESDKKNAIERLHTAISHYRGSLRKEPNQTDARANIELAAALIKRLSQQEPQSKQEPQQEQDSSQDQEQQDSQSESKKQSENQEQSGNEEQRDSQQQQGDQPQTDQQGKESEPTENSKESDQQQQQQNATSESDSMQQPSKPPTSDPSPSESEETTAEQSPADSQQSPQPSPEGELSALEENEAGQSAQDMGQAMNESAEEGMMTREEALKLLQAVRDRDMLRRMQQQRREQSQRVIVEKDW